MIEAKLVVVGGDAKATEVRLKLPTVIGRGREAGLTVPHALVSRRHTEIFEKEGRLFVRDLGSLNGTFVNKTKIDGDQFLAPNQLLTLGNITFRAVYEVEGVGEDTVTFDEVKTAVGTSPVASKKPAKKEFVKKEPAKKEFVKFEAAESEAEKSESVSAEDGSVLDSDENASASDTQKSILGSEVFIETEEENPANKSVAVSALDELPSAAAPAVSFVGKVDFGDEVKKPASQIDPVEIDLGDEDNEKSVDDDSSLGSFLNKLPR